MVYKWKDASRIKTKPEIAAKVLYELADKDSLNPGALVEASKPLDAPLHNEFEWDNSVAAEEWRKHQARNIINALVLVPEDDEPLTKAPVRAFFKIPELKSNYDSVIALVSKPDTRELLLRKAQSELNAIREKYQTLQELADIWKAIEGLKVETEAN